ncbi:MAG: hypothetical protein K1X49_03540 [Saprospiraceae bacterium]|jgi:hypothetical protein|nr:hypothetical protein [Saprospiraceae bacterium]
MSNFKTIVSKVDKFPLPIVIGACFLLLVNFSGLFMFLTNLDGIVPGLKGSNTEAVQQLAYQIGARQFIPIVIFLFAIFYKDVRVFQIAWLIALIREIGDFAGAMANHPSTAGLIFIVVCMVLEISSFIYLGMIASGKIQKYIK